MAGPYPLATLGPTFTASGITIPSYADCLASLQASFQAIYGTNAYISPDSQDGQWIAIQAKAYSDLNNAIVALYQSFSPSFAQGVQLSSLVRINGLTRIVPTNSSAVCAVAGTVGTVITSGVAQDVNGNLWNLPTPLTIPVSGSVNVTVTAQQPGNIVAAANTINKIFNPQLGWQTINNPAQASPGTTVETDAALRVRQATSVALTAQTPLSSIAAAVAAVAGVTRSTVYENQGAVTDGNGVPSHSIAAIVQGGATTAIGSAIESTKSPGTGTYGTTSVIVVDPSGLPVNINYFVLTLTNIYVAITIHPLVGFVSGTGQLVINALSNFISTLAIGQSVPYSWLYSAAGLGSVGVGQTFEITALTSGFASNPTGTADLPIAFNAAASAPTGNISLSIV